MNRFLIKVFDKKATQFSIVAKLNQNRKELVKEVDSMIGHLNYGAENYEAKNNLFLSGCFGWIE